MRIVTTGITRTVFIFKNFVIKVPKIRYGWYYFLLGLCGNIEEKKTWEAIKDNPDYNKLLCPIKWASKSGLIVIMEKADVEGWDREVGSKFDQTDDWYLRKVLNGMLYKKWIDAGFGGDDKSDNYGYYKGRLVKVDYPNFSDTTPTERFKNKS